MFFLLIDVILLIIVYIADWRYDFGFVVLILADCFCLCCWFGFRRQIVVYHTFITHLGKTLFYTNKINKVKNKKQLYM